MAARIQKDCTAFIRNLRLALTGTAGFAQTPRRHRPALTDLRPVKVGNGNNS
jgi:hypothetical protein